MAENVEYILSLKDLLTSQLKGADAAAKGLEGSISGVQKVLGILGLAGGAFAAFEFLKSSVSDFNESAQASAQLDASLRSTANAANLNRDALDAQAAALMKTSLYDDDAITGAQAMLATFTQVKDKIYMDAVPAITDLATKMGGDLQGATIQVGKALNDPIQGINALRRVGVSFSESQRLVIENLVNTGKIAEAQKLILKELNTEFGGSAKAAAEAGTGGFTVLAHEMQNAKEDLGQFIVEISSGLVPYLRRGVEMFADMVKGIRNFNTWLHSTAANAKALQIVIGTVVTGLIAYKTTMIAVSIVQTAYSTGMAILTAYATASAAATDTLTFAQWALNAAMTANPIGLIIAGIAAFIGAIVLAYEKVGWFHAGLWGLFAAMKEIASVVKDIFTGLYHHIHGILTFNKDEIIAGGQQAAQAMLESGKRIGSAFSKGYDEGMADFNKGQVKAGQTAKPKPTKAGLAPEAAPDISAKKATGTKSITINISINKLIETFRIETTNLSEGANKVRELVANTIVQSVNDAAITANM